MPNHLSILGIFHTAISVIALIVAFYALLRTGKINPADSPGKLYVILTVITCLTAFPIMKTGHPTPGHYVAVIVLVLLTVAIFAERIFKKSGDYVQVIAMSATLFLSLIPAIIETLSRVPLNQPIASGPNDPIIQNGLSVLMLLFLAGVIYQVIKLRASRRQALLSK